ncbi:hypothetical protein M407DRAFT_102562 [Tulasnella calospora MUT 4182]|uniref:Uncharacterized protein n=1 Tax=Tulasnella calospora MUT 4182 TaxID=1051891 RepID=A0A0C3LS86_9AGAM|nr:hypothetical protein M407DRAFT_102562 [Tulasnella calospora MUT 4182]
MSTKLIISLHNTNRGRKRGGERGYGQSSTNQPERKSFQPPQLLHTTHTSPGHDSIHPRPHPIAAHPLDERAAGPEKTKKEKNDQRGGEKQLQLWSFLSF